MDHPLSVVVQIDLAARCVHLVVTGDLTERNHRALAPLVDRARTLIPGVTVAVDLTSARHVDPAGLDLLQWSLDHGPAPEPGDPVQVLTRPVPIGFAEATRPAARPHAPAPAAWNGSELDGVAA